MADLLGLRIAGKIDDKAAPTGGTGGWPFDNVRTVSQTDANADHATIAAAITAASAGDVILLDAETFTETLTLNKAVTLIGLDPIRTIITSASATLPTIDVTTANAAIKNLTVTQSGAGSINGGVRFAAAGRAENVEVNITGAGDGTNSYGIRVTTTSAVEIIDCEVNGTGTAANPYGIGTLVAANLTVRGGVITAFSGSLLINHASAVVTLDGPTLVGGVAVVTAGTLRGEALDQYGRRLRLKPIGITNGRMTLTTGVPVTTADVNAATTIRYTPYLGGKCEVYNGSFWIEAPFTELSLSLSGFTADMNSDLWVYDNAGTLTLERTEWTNDTTRATAITRQDGRLCKSGTLTRLYLGTFRTTSATGQTEDSVTNRYVWNYYNRVPRGLRRANNTSHTYNTNTVQPFNNDAPNSQVEFVVGVIEDVVSPGLTGRMTKGSTTGIPQMHLSLNTTTALTSHVIVLNIDGDIRYSGFDNFMMPRLGYNFLVVTESTTVGAAAATFAVGIVAAAVLG